MKKTALLILLSILSVIIAPRLAKAQCTPGYSAASYGCSYMGYSISSFYVTGYSGAIADAAACTGSGYQDFYSTDSVVFMQSISYSSTISAGGYNRMNCEVYIDFNNNSTFEASESVGGYNNYTYSGSFNIAIPMTAAVGVHRMRLVTCDNYSGYYPHLDPCASGYAYGEARDYKVRIAALPACAAAPATATAVSTTATACPSVPFTLSLTGSTVATGLTYQWQKSSTGTTGTFTNITGATNPTYTLTHSVLTYYQCVVTCAAASASTASTVVAVNYISACYCTPSYTYASLSCSTYYMALTDYLLNGYSSTSIHDAAACDGSGYLDRTSLSCSLMQSVTYTPTVTVGTTYTLNSQTWIDLNNDGTFATSESVGGFNSRNGAVDYGITPPVTAAVGTHRMRIIVSYSGSGYTYPSMDPCTSGYYYGEGRDYSVNIVALPACTGTPSAGGAIASTGSACPSAPFTITDTGFTVAGSLTFQWYSSPDSSTWTAISGATNPSHTLTETATTYYHCVVTCTSTGGGSSISLGVKVNYLSVCYCTPTYTSASASCSTYNFAISRVYTVGDGGSTMTDAAACTGTGYQDRTALSVNYMQSVSYLCTVTPSTASTTSYTMNNQFWIDFNNDGTFATSESVGGRNSYSSASPIVDTLHMPLTASVGNHRMRLVQVYSSPSYPSINPCVPSYSYGEARDYTVNIVALPPCSGTPTAGTVSSSVATACPSTPFTLYLSGYTVAGSMTFQWERSTDSSSWSAISGATGLTLTTTESTGYYYRCVVTCTISGSSDRTAGLFIPYVSYCYCTPTFSSASASCYTYNFAMNSFHTSGEFGTYIADNIPCDGSGYQNHTSMSVTYMQTRFYADTIVSSTGTYAYTLNNQVWIDYSNNGTFESSETVTGLNGYSGLPATAVDTFTMSMSSALGTHRMRVMQVYSGSGYTYPTLNPCATSYSYGEARDYTAVIVALPPCSSTVTGGTAVSSVGTACPSLSFVCSVTGSTLASGLTYQWQRSSDGISWSTISGATGASYSTTISAVTYFRRYLICTSTSASDTSSAVMVNYISYCYCSPSYSVAGLACGSYAMGTTHYYVPGVAGTSIDDYTHCNGSTNYSNLTSMSVSIVQGSTVAAKIYNGAASGINMCVQTWIDYNDNGTFTTSTESVGGANSFHDSLTYNLYISSSAAVGAHRMRTVTTYDGSGYTYPTLDPCTAGYALGDARDYTVNIVLTGCTSTPTAGSVSATATAGCTSFSPLLSLTGATVGGGITYQWQSSPTGSTWTNVSGATASTYMPTVTTNTYYRVILTCPYTGTSATATQVYLTVSPSPSTPSGPSYVCSGATTTAPFTATPSGGTWSTGSTSIATIGSTSGFVTGVATGASVVSYTLASGCYSVATILVNPTPAAITGYPTMCVGGSVTLADASTGGTWSSSNASIASVSSTGVVSGLSAGSAVISYTLSTGCSSSASSATRTVTVNANPGAILGSYSICLGATSSLTSSTSGGTWSSASPTIATVDASGVAHSYSVGTSDVTYTNPSTGCYTTATLTVNPTVTPTLSISATPGYTICSGTSVTFTSATTNAGTSPTFVWSVNGVISGGASTYTYAPANGDVISLWLRSSAACPTPDTLRSTVSMAVNPSLTPTVSISTGVGDTLCLGTSATITATPVAGGSAPVYHWWVNGVTAGSTAGSLSYTPANGDVITCRLYSNDNCRLADSASTAKTLTVFATATPSVGLTSTLGPIVCAGSAITYTATPSAGGTAPVYQWTVNGTAVGTSSPTYSYTPANADVVQVLLTSNFPCISTATATNSMTMTVDPVVSPVGTVSVSPGYIIYPGTYATFTSAITSGAGSFPSYQWTRNGATISGATNSTLTTNVLYTGDVICCNVTNNDPCGGSSTFSCVTITIGTNVGVQEVGSGVANVTVLPNPNSGAFTIKGSLGISSDELVNLEITNMLGQVVYTNKVNAKGGELNQSISLDGNLANGMYLINVKSDHVSKVFHFVLEQ